MKFSRIIQLSLCASGLSLAVNLPAYAGPVTQVTHWGTVDPGCTNEWAACATDPAFTPPTGGYRAGGSVSWSFSFDRSGFSSVSSIQLDVLVVGFWGSYPGNIDAAAGQLGDYLAIDGAPFAPFLGMTDGRDLRTFSLSADLAAGPHTFSVVAYDDPWRNYEGWAGVDYATLTVTGMAAAIPEADTYSLLLAGLGLLAFITRRRKQ